MPLILLVALLLAPAALLNAQSKSLDMYWVDVEGGAATLIVAPSGESLLIDSGFAAGIATPSVSTQPRSKPD
jgi:hypothetical protein